MNSTPEVVAPTFRWITSLMWVCIITYTHTHAHTYVCAIWILPQQWCADILLDNFINVSVYKYIYANTHTYIYVTHTHTYMCVQCEFYAGSGGADVPLDIITNMSVYMYIYTHTHINTYMRVRMYRYINIHSARRHH